MKSNQELQTDVQKAITWEPLLNAAQIGVTAEDGIITLTGTVDSYAKKLEAEDAAKNVAGVKAVVEKIEIKFYSSLAKRDDSEIASEVVNAFKWHWEIPSDKVKVKVENGWVTLEGDLIWNYQKEATIKAVKNLFGVKGVTNSIKIKSEIYNAIEEDAIKDALRRNWSLDANEIEVAVSGNTVTLSGTVISGYQKAEAEKIAWKAPGVWHVENNLVVVYDHAFVD
jgi:osmotically-inducible protein OsmY